MKEKFLKPGTLEYILSIITSYPLRQQENYRKGLEIVNDIKIEAEKLIKELESKGIVEERNILTGLRNIETDILISYEELKMKPYEIAKYLDIAKIEEGSLTNYFINLLSFCKYAESLLKERLSLRKR